MFIPENFCTWLGLALLSSLGIYTIIKGLFFQKGEACPDFDRPMNFKESTVLSLAVSVDAFSAGLGYAMMGHTSYIIPIGVGIFHSIFISLGIGFSRHAIRHFNLSKKLLTILSGSIIILVALSRLIF
jgi:putative Mn2+ efflux pump MntP